MVWVLSTEIEHPFIGFGMPFKFVSDLSIGKTNVKSESQDREVETDFAYTNE
jgi:hypothetical protein